MFLLAKRLVQRLGFDEQAVGLNPLVVLEREQIVGLLPLLVGEPARFGGEIRVAQRLEQRFDDPPLGERLGVALLGGVASAEDVRPG